jgi:hypothetical protein
VYDANGSSRQGGEGQQSLDLRRVKRNLAAAAFGDREPEALAERGRRTRLESLWTWSTGLGYVFRTGICIEYWNTYCALGLVLRGCLYGAYLESYAYVGGGNVGRGMGWA